MVNIKTAEKLLKDYYLDVVREQFDTGVNAFYSMIEKTTENVYGNTVKKAVLLDNGNHIVPVKNDDDAINQAGSAKYATLTTTLKNLYGTIEISDKALRTSQNSEGSIVNLLNLEMENLLNNAKKDFGNMLFSGSVYAVAKIVKKIDDETYVVDDSSKIKVGDELYGYSTSRDIEPYGIISFKVGSVNTGTNTISLIPDHVSEIGFDVGFILAYDSKNNQKCLTGLLNIFDPAYSLYGVNVEAKINEWIKPTKVELSEKLTVEDIQEMIDTIEERSGDIPNIIICSWKARRIMQKLFAEKNISLENTVLDGGYKAISYNGIPIVVDKYCAQDEIYFLNTEYFKLCQLCDWEWLEDDKGSILRQVPNKAVFTATLVKYADLLCEKPSAQGRIVLSAEDMGN